MKIAIATDHNGVNEKKEIMELMKNVEFVDYSPNNYDTDDYPDFAFKVAEDVAAGKVDLGVLMCGTGIGMSIAANKVKGIICGHCSSVEQAHLTREHNHANILALSYKQAVPELVEMIREFLNTEPSKEERHNRRVNKILDYEKAR
ncbi:MAG: RpiB/LacA/LacB family sugar-phosphate isomerase [Bacilli bacterium]|nr:RpiB/LacA/LacB family sugar-phosphate isomerase [Bacilli bacterium]